MSISFEELLAFPDFTDVKRRVEQLVFRKEGIRVEDVIESCRELYKVNSDCNTYNAIADLVRLGQIHCVGRCLHLGGGGNGPALKCLNCEGNDVGYMMRTRRARTSDNDRTHHRKVLGILCNDCVESYPDRGKYKFVSFENYKVTMED